MNLAYSSATGKTQHKLSFKVEYISLVFSWFSFSLTGGFIKLKNPIYLNIEE